MTTMILTYHAIGPVDSPLFTPLPRFESHLEALSSGGWTSLTVPELVRALRAGEPLPSKTVALTFDDAYETVFTLARPRMAAAGFKATLFPVTSFIGKSNRWPGQPRSVPDAKLMDWSMLSTMAAGGFAIGSHSDTHLPLTQISADQAAGEWTRSRALLEDRLHVKVSIAAPPYGARNAATDRIVEELFEGSVSTRLGLVRKGGKVYNLPRVDSFYVNRYWTRRIDGPALNAYLALRNLGRLLRRTVRSDWDS